MENTKEKFYLWAENSIKNNDIFAILTYFASKYIELQASEKDREIGKCFFDLEYNNIKYRIEYSFEQKQIYISPEEKVQEALKQN